MLFGAICHKLSVERIIQTDSTARTTEVIISKTEDEHPE